MKIPKRIRAWVHATLPFAMRPVWWLVGARRAWRDRTVATRQKRVLLVCQNVVAAEHLKPIIELLRRRGDVRLQVTNDHFPAQEIDAESIRNRTGVAYRHVLACLFVDWDLIIYVNHPWGFASWMAPCLPKMYINHGLYSGKINNDLGEDGVYGPHRTTRPHRGLLYDCMLAASKAERRAALKADPSLEGVVRVAGSLVADRIVEASRGKAAIRQRLGIDPTRRIIHVISTWGPASLMERMGDALLDMLHRQGRLADVLVSIHPRLDKFGGVSASRDALLQRWSSRGARTDRDNERWSDFVAASDIAIGDHSSLVLYHCLLHHPVIFVPVDKGACLPGSPFEQWRSHGIQLHSAADLPRALDQADNATAGFGAMHADLLVEGLGQADLLHMREIDRLLQR